MVDGGGGDCGGGGGGGKGWGKAQGQTKLYLLSCGVSEGRW